LAGTKPFDTGQEKRQSEKLLGELFLSATARCSGSWPFLHSCSAVWGWISLTIRSLRVKTHPVFQTSWGLYQNKLWSGGDLPLLEVDFRKLFPGLMKFSQSTRLLRSSHIYLPESNGPCLILFESKHGVLTSLSTFHFALPNLESLCQSF